MIKFQMVALTLWMAVNSFAQTLNTQLLTAAEKGDVETVKSCLGGGAKVDVENKDGETSLVLGSKNGHLAVVQALLEKKADLEAKDDNGNTALIQAARNGRATVLKVLIAAGAKLDAENLDGQIALKLAELEKRSEAVEILQEAMRKNGTVDKAAAATALSLALVDAAKKGNYEQVDALIFKGANVNRAESDFASPLATAVRAKHPDVVRLLLKKGANPNIFQLATLVSSQDLEMVKLFIEYKVDMNGSDYTGNPPLIAAIKINKPEMVKLLLDNKVEVNEKDSSGKTALDYAQGYNYKEIVSFLQKAGAGHSTNVGSHSADILFEAIGRDNLEQVKSLVDNGINVNERDAQGSTPLLHLLRVPQYLRGSNSVQIAKYLVTRGADVNEVGQPGAQPPLLLAVGRNDTELTLLLLEKGAKVNVAAGNGTTPLMVVVEQGDIVLVRAMIKAGADLSVKDQKGNSALSIATKIDRKDIVDVLKQAGAKE